MLKKLNKKLLLLTIVLGMMMLALAGCGGTSGGDQKELEGWLQEAADQYNAESLRGYVNDITQETAEGKTEWKSYITVDTEKKIAMDKTEGNGANGVDSNGDAVPMYSFYTKEGDKYYFYGEGISTGSSESEEPLVTEVSFNKDVDASKGYDFYASEDFTAAGDQSIEEVECTLTNEGEEDGYIKIKEAYKYKTKAMIPEEITRESLLAENDWTEDDIALVDGASEDIDAYVEENAANIKILKDAVFEGTNYFWLTKDEHKLVKKERITDETQQAEAGVKNDAQKKFYNETMYKIYMVMDKIESEGMSKEEANKYAEANLEVVDNFGAEIKSYTGVCTILIGDECEPLKALPEDGKTYKVEEYN